MCIVFFFNNFTVLSCRKQSEKRRHHTRPIANPRDPPRMFLNPPRRHGDPPAAAAAAQEECVVCLQPLSKNLNPCQNCTGFFPTHSDCYAATVGFKACTLCPLCHRGGVDKDIIAPPSCSTVWIQPQPPREDSKIDGYITCIKFTIIFAIFIYFLYASIRPLFNSTP